MSQEGRSRWTFLAFGMREESRTPFMMHLFSSECIGVPEILTTPSHCALLMHSTRGWQGTSTMGCPKSLMPDLEMYKLKKMRTVADPYVDRR